MKTFDEIERALIRANELVAAGKKHEARALALTIHADAQQLGLTHGRGSIHEGRALLFMQSASWILHNTRS